MPPGGANWLELNVTPALPAFGEYLSRGTIRDEAATGAMRDYRVFGVPGKWRGLLLQGSILLELVQNSRQMNLRPGS
jgi:hypothetical protein